MATAPKLPHLKMNDCCLKQAQKWNITYRHKSASTQMQVLNHDRHRHTTTAHKSVYQQLHFCNSHCTSKWLVCAFMLVSTSAIASTNACLLHYAITNSHSLQPCMHVICHMQALSSEIAHSGTHYHTIKCWLFHTLKQLGRVHAAQKHTPWAMSLADAQT